MGVDAALHHCADDPLGLAGRLTYLPALDPLAQDVPGGGKVLAPICVESIGLFDYVPSRDGGCWICAYAEALRTKRVDPTEPLGQVVDIEVARQRARSRLTSTMLLEIAKRALREAEAQKRDADDALAPHYRPMTEEEIATEDRAAAAVVGMNRIAKLAVQAIDLGAMPAEAVAMLVDNAPIKDDVLEVPPEAVDAMAKDKRGRRKKSDGSPGQGSLF